MTRNIKLMAVLYFLGYATMCIPMTFQQNYLEVLGYSVFERGILLSSMAIVAIVAQYFIGYLCDFYKTNKRFYQLVVVLIAISSFLLYTSTSINFIYHIFLVGILGGLLRTLMALQDAWVLEVDPDCKRQFGFIRGMGSLGWIFATYLTSYTIVNLGYSYLGYFTLIIAIILIIYSFRVPDAQKSDDVETINSGDIKLLLVNKQFVFVVLILFLINVMDSANNYTVMDKMIILNAPTSIIASRYTFQALVELPIFFLGAKLLKRFEVEKLLIVSVFFYAIRFILYGMAQSPIQMIFATLLQFVCFSLFMLTSKILVDKIAPNNLKSTAQTLASSLSNGTSLLFTPIISGFLISVIGIDNTLYTLALVGFVALALTVVYRNKYSLK